jgi:hypothetical protein
MKKVLVSICFMFAAVTMVSAQRAAEKKAEIKKGLKEQVMLTDSQIESVISIEDEYRPKLKEVKNDATLSETDKSAKTKALQAEKKAKLEAALGKETAEKVASFYTEQKHKAKAEGDNSEKKERKGKKDGSGNK